jgi:hypothetical protein
MRDALNWQTKTKWVGNWDYYGSHKAMLVWGKA